MPYFDEPQAYDGSCTAHVSCSETRSGKKPCTCPGFVPQADVPEDERLVDDGEVEKFCARCGHTQIHHNGPKRLKGVTWDPVKGFSQSAEAKLELQMVEGQAYSAEDYFRLAEAALYVNPPDKARAKKEFKAALAVDTSHAPSCVGLAELLLAERDYRKAEELVKQVLGNANVMDAILKNRAEKVAQECVTHGDQRPQSRWKPKKAWKKAGNVAALAIKSKSESNRPISTGKTGGFALGAGSRPGSRTVTGHSKRPTIGTAKMETIPEMRDAEIQGELQGPNKAEQEQSETAKDSSKAGASHSTAADDDKAKPKGAVVKRSGRKGGNKDGLSQCEMLWASYMFRATDDWLQQWDMVSLALVFYTIYAAPYEVAFLEPQMGALFLINRFIDIFFFSDMILQFFIKPVDELGRIVNNPRTIAYNYLTSWFIVDLVSVVPFDLISVLSNSDELGDLKAVRVIRVLRLVKLLRVFRVSRLLIKWQNMYSIDYNWVQLCFYGGIVITSAHWFACLYKLVQAMEATSPNWVQADSNNKSKSDEDTYLGGFFWAVQTISSIGYGDVGPQTTAERLFVTFGMMAGAMVFSLALGAICGAVASMYVKADKYHRLIDDTNEFMEDVKAPYDLQVAVRRYFKNRYEKNTLTNDMGSVTDMLSPSLREEVAMHSHKDWVTSIPFFRGCPDKFVCSLAVSMQVQSFTPRELVFEAGSVANLMFVVKDGVVGHIGRVVTKGKVFGEEVLHNLIHMPVKRQAKATCLTFVDVYALPYNKLKDVLRRYPHVLPRVCTVAIKGIMLQHVLAFTKACQNYATGATGQSDHSLVREMEEELLSRKEKYRKKLGVTDPYNGVVRQSWVRELTQMKQVLRQLGAKLAAMEAAQAQKADSRATEGVPLFLKKGESGHTVAFLSPVSGAVQRSEAKFGEGHFLSTKDMPDLEHQGGSRGRQSLASMTQKGDYVSSNMPDAVDIMSAQTAEVARMTRGVSFNE